MAIQKIQQTVDETMEMTQHPHEQQATQGTERETEFLNQEKIPQVPTLQLTPEMRMFQGGHAQEVAEHHYPHPVCPQTIVN